MAATYLEHIKITMFGVIGVPTNPGPAGPQEIWSCGLRMWSPSGMVMTPAQLQLIGVNAMPKVVTWFTDFKIDISPTCGLTGIKVIWVKNTGAQRDQDTVLVNAPQGTIGNGADGTPIWEQSYAQTFRTAVQRGRGHSGRIYPPLNGAQPAGGTPYITPQMATAMATSTAKLLGDLRDAINNAIAPTASDFKAAVMSAGDTTSGRAPLATLITGVVVDRVADIQHRRTNAVPRAEGSLMPIPA